MHRGTWVPVCTAVAALAAGCGSSSSATTSTPAAAATSTPAPTPRVVSGWTGMGAPLSSFASAHPKNLAHCSAGTCFGSQLTNSEGSTTEFTLVQTTGGPDGRVDGYTQAFNDGTTVAEAKGAVLALMPRATKTTAYFIQHDGNGATCAFWNVQSATLGKWFSTPKVGDSRGVMGIELSTVDANGNAIFKAGDVTEAIINLAPVDRSQNC
jgi:hypothetical protein